MRLIHSHASLVTLLTVLLLSNITYGSDQLQDWREYEATKKEAIERIEKHRKGSTSLNLQLPNGKSASSINVDIQLKRHEFLWGAVVQCNYFLKSPHSQKYKDNFHRYFNAAGIANSLKPKQRGKPVEEEAVLVAKWFKDNNFYLRGHALVWEGANFMREEQLAIYNDEALSDEEKAKGLKKSMEEHFYHAIPKWNVDCWDVTNEPIVNNALNDLLPDDNTHAHWFTLADNIRKTHGRQNVRLFVNDYEVISAILPYGFTLKRPRYEGVGRLAIYKELIQGLIDEGTPVEGIGFQSRLKGGMISPADIYDRLCTFDEFNLPYHCTEFSTPNVGPPTPSRKWQKEFEYTDEQRRLLFEFMMVTCFSHPKVEGLWAWTFCESTGQDRPQALFSYDGTPKEGGKTWIALMDGFFNTELSAKTNNDGKIGMNGYFGDYEVTAKQGNNTYKGTFKLAKGGDNKLINVTLNP